jgi:hypothetical protein
MALVCASSLPVTYARIPRSARLSRAFLRVTKRSNPRDGLFKAITPSPRGAQRSSPNDSRKGSNSRALTALLESWVNDSRDSASPGKRHRDANKAPRGAGEQQTNRARREGVSRCSHLPLGSLRRFQASSNTYPNGLTPRQQTAALWRLCTTSTKGKGSMRGKPIIHKKRTTRHDGKPRLDPSIVELAAVLEAIAAMDALPLASSPPPRRRRRRCAT